MRDEEKWKIEWLSFIREQENKVKITSWLVIAVGVIILIGWIGTLGNQGSNA